MTSIERDAKDAHHSDANLKSPKMASRHNHSNSNATPLTLFDLNGLGMGFGLYRPRRASYTFATQQNRARSESYRCATRREYLDSSSDCAAGDDFIEDVLKHRRKTSYTQATKSPSSNVKMPYVRRGDGQNVNTSTSTGTGTSTNTCSNTGGGSNTTSDVATSVETDSLTPVTEKSDTSFQTSRDDTDNSRCGDDDRHVVYKNNMDANVIARIKLTDIKNINVEGNGKHVVNINAHRILPPPAQVRLSGNQTRLVLGHNDIEANGSAMTRNCHNQTRRNFERGVNNFRKSMSDTLRFNKNLVVLSISFIFIFSSFQAIQNIQSSLNSTDSLGTISMMLVHVSMVFACLVAPTIINHLTAKWALCIGVVCFLIWFGANFYPKFYTLIPSAVLVGLGQGVVWSAESSYIQKLAFDSARINKVNADEEMFRFHGIFLACFQTTHIWGNLISSLWFSQQDKIKKSGQATSSGIPIGVGQEYLDFDAGPGAMASNMTSYGLDPGVYYGEGGEMAMSEDYGGAAVGDSSLPVSRCGALFRCDGPDIALFHGGESGVGSLSGVLWKLMIFYVLFGIIAFVLIIILLDHIGARADPGKTPRQIIIQHTGQLFTHKTLRLLIPLLLFNGMQQGFMYSDYNLYFVTCSLGVDYVGYCMITLGVANVLGAVFVTLFAHRIPREVILGFGGILHIALMIGYLIWIPEQKPVLFCVLAAAWGICDAVWQTQCNTLICLTCVEEPDVAFTNYRLVQSVGLALVFGMGSWVCVSVKLYLLMTLLVLAIMFYVLAEYQLRHTDDDVF